MLWREDCSKTGRWVMNYSTWWKTSSWPYHNILKSWCYSFGMPWDRIPVVGHPFTPCEANDEQFDVSSTQQSSHLGKKETRTFYPIKDLRMQAVSLSLCLLVYAQSLSRGKNIIFVHFSEDIWNAVLSETNEQSCETTRSWMMSHRVRESN